MADHKDVALAILGAAAGLAGLVLVFVGFLISAIGALPPGSDAAVYRPYRRSAVGAAVAFGLSLLAVALATAWLLAGDRGTALYVSVTVVFFAALVALAVSAAVAMRLLIWRS